jgi:hypothetical protein
MGQRSIDAAAIEAEVDQIRSLGIDALRKRWRMMFGAAPPKGLTKDIIGEGFPATFFTDEWKQKGLQTTFR